MFDMAVFESDLIAESLELGGMRFEEEQAVMAELSQEG